MHEVGITKFVEGMQEIMFDNEGTSESDRVDSFLLNKSEEYGQSEVMMKD